jgi:hypothetical protein
MLFEQCRLRADFGDSLWKTRDREGWIASEEFLTIHNHEKFGKEK